MAPQDKKASILQEKIRRLHRQEEEKRARNLAARNNLPYLNLSIAPIEPDAVGLLPEEQARGAQAAVFKAIKKKIWLALANPKNMKTQKLIQDLEKSGYQINLFVVSPHGLEKAWQSYQELPAPKKEITGKLEILPNILKNFQKEIKTLKDGQAKIEQFLADNKDLSGLVEIIMASALQAEASDIHLEKKEKDALVRYRIDGILHDVVFLSEKVYSLILSRIKLLSQLKLNIKDAAQDGRFTIQIEARALEIRTSCVPGAYGENIAMRILDPKRLLDLEKLGFREDLLTRVSEEIKKPNGMLIIAGPTGSGKTTSLYAFLKKINSPEIKIITLEDPIEYHLKGIIQTQIEEEKGYGFAAGLRSILRQDPNVILVGEIRDNETAEVSLRAASTGHLVFTTLHTNDAASAIPYLIELGSKPTFLSSSLNLIIAQRLARRICSQCHQEYKISPTELDKLKKGLVNISAQLKILLPALDKNLKLAKGKGCPVCHYTGYKGRVGVFELILVTPELEKLINTGPSHIQIEETASQQEMVTMYQDGLIKVIQGVTTIEEVERIIN